MSILASVACLIGGVWCYHPYECEAWLLQRSRAEVDAGLAHVSYPGSFLTLAREPACFFSEVPVAGYEAIAGKPDMPPHRRALPETRMPFKRTGELYDRGTLDIGYVRAKASVEPRLFVGESRAEALSSDTNGFEQSTRMIEESPGCWRSAIPLALRYARFATPVTDVVFDSQVDWSARPQPLACTDAHLRRAWEIGVETLRRCKRHFIVDGIKRDRLPWAADLVIAILAEAHSFRDAETIKRTLAAIGSGDPSTTQVNGILPFSLWWVIAHDLLQRHFDEGAFLRLHYPRICARMDELAGHEDARGFIVRDLGWDFMDWTDDGGGSLQSEITRQIIYFGALRAAARLAGRMGDAARLAAWNARAERLRERVLSVGMDGTRHARMMAIVFGLVDGAQVRQYAREIAADTLPPTVTPYMATFEVLALAKGGERAAARRKFEQVWGRMTDAGVDAFWEGWDERQKGDTVYVFYGRPFGKSLCHAWSAGPVFLVPMLFASAMPEASAGFRSAQPVWPEGQERTLNAGCQFCGEFAADGKTPCHLRVAAAYPYRVTLNGVFAGYGPARAAPGFFRVDDWPLAATAGVNRVTIETYAGNCACFYFPKQTPFVQAEVDAGDAVVLATGRNFPAFETARIRRVPRAASQRLFQEAYRIDGADVASRRAVRLAVQSPRRLLPREYAYPKFGIDASYRPISRERVRDDPGVKTWEWGSRQAAKDAANYYDESEIEANPFKELQRLVTVERHAVDASDRTATHFRLAENEGVTFGGDVDRAGFARFTVTCAEPCRIYLTFDEMLQEDGSINTFRVAYANCAEWIFEKPGTYAVEMFEPTAFRYARLLAIGAPAEVSAVTVRTYESPAVGRARFASSDPALSTIFEAARRSLAANAVDCLTDCPTRERAGWCGDTYFTGRACQYLTGDGTLERLFLSNWLMPERFDCADDRRDLTPAVYPSDLRHTDATYIPNYGLWFILQVEGYAQRTGDWELVRRFRRRLEGIMDFMARYENADGLLEKLPFWVFIDWSESNKLVQDVNYPSSMLYAAALDALHRMYDRPDFAAKAARLRTAIRAQSWTGAWFCDNAVRQADGTLKPTGTCTESCQYYAFFSGVASRERDADLWQRLVRDFGPERRATGLYPEIAPANFTLGQCIRGELLSEAGACRRLLEEMRRRFLPMAEKTGTLWEHEQQGHCCSCCHGLASIAAVYLLRDVLGVRRVDPVAKTVTLSVDPDLPLDWCEGELPLPDGKSLVVKWHREHGVPKLDCTLPPGWVAR